jgi:hypothetical protein
MSGRAAELIQEVRQITLQYKAEVPGHRRAWPEAIKKRVTELFSLGLKTRKISEVTGISIHTLSLWKSQINGGQSFQQLKIIDAAESKAKSELLATAKANSFATVTVTKKRGRPPKVLSPQQLDVANNVTVTVTTPDGFRIEGVPVREALQWIIRGVR